MLATSLVAVSLALMEQRAVEAAVRGAILPGSYEASEPMSEVSHPGLRIRHISFPTADTAIVYGESVQLGSLISMRITSVSFHLRKVDGAWETNRQYQ